MSSLDTLFEAAKAIQAKAYAPYSRFKVGAAIATPESSRPRQRNARRPRRTTAPHRRPSRAEARRVRGVSHRQKHP